MTIKQQGGIFGRNPSFNDASVEDLTVTNSVSVPNDSISGDAVDGGTITPTKLLVNTDANPNSVNSRFFGITEFDSAGATLVDFLTSNGATTLGSIGQGNYVVSGAPSNSFGIRSNANLPIAAGGSTKVADFTVNGLAFVNGKGIDFSATSGTGTSELFDDYEEGTWTPEFSSTDATFNHSFQVGNYTKVGREVFVHAFIRGASSGTLSNLVTITGLPYASKNASNVYCSVTFGQLNRVDYPAGAVAITGFIQSNETQIRLITASDDGNAASLTAAAFDGTSAAGFMLSASYFTD